jgi:Recombination enhancement, RecA-dependent nuclease
MKSALPPPTKQESRRMEIIAREIGCIACRKYGNDGVWANVHHLIDPKTGNRISHDATIPLCPMHHDQPGGSIHRNKVWFAETFGTDEELLAETNRLVSEFESNVVGAV